MRSVRRRVAELRSLAMRLEPLSAATTQQMARLDLPTAPQALRIAGQGRRGRVPKVEPELMQQEPAQKECARRELAPREIARGPAAQATRR